MGISIRACTMLVAFCCIMFMTHQRQELQTTWVMAPLLLLFIITVVWVAFEHE